MMPWKMRELAMKVINDRNTPIDSPARHLANALMTYFDPEHFSHAKSKPDVEDSLYFQWRLNTQPHGLE